ncbi:MAG TPA: helix-turn-helix domain-containing protein [Streptosporangiaceae bacterium]|nr:helix-turn-helix domain-containing protein [Streptosporangiaceae bacterium]
MSRSSRIVITLPVADRRELAKRARSYTSPHAEVVRARIVLLAADGEANVAIARRRDVGADVVSKWRKRFARTGFAGLCDRNCSGRPRVFPARWYPR